MATITETRRTHKVSPGMLAWFALVGILILIGLVSALQVFIKGLDITNMYDNVPWGLWITIDLSAIALGAGAFTLSAIVYLFGLKRFQPIVRLAVFVGFIGYSAALLTLVMDIGRPDRFWHPWVYWNVHSVLWEITWCITIYLTIMIMEFLPVITEHKFFDRMPWMREVAVVLHKAAPVFALLGLGISLLHQSSLGATYGIVKSRPIWFKPEHANHVHTFGNRGRPGFDHHHRLDRAVDYGQTLYFSGNPAHNCPVQRVRAPHLWLHQILGSRRNYLLWPNA